MIGCVGCNKLNMHTVIYIVKNKCVDFPSRSRRLSPMPKKTAATVEPTDTITSIFTVRRDLVQVVKSVVAGSSFTVEEADLLISLFGVRELDWDDLPHDAQGDVTFKELELYLVHNASLLSRRIRKFTDSKPPLLEVAEPEPGSGLHFNALRVRITAEGVKRIHPVWERFSQMSVNLVKGIPPQLLKAHQQVNEEISTRIRRRRQGATDFLVDF